MVGCLIRCSCEFTTLTAFALTWRSWAALHSSVGMAAFSFPGMTNAGYAVMGCHMNRSKALSLLPVLLLAALSLAACSGPKTGTICISNCGGTGTVSLTMVADTLPANPSLVTFKVTITG